MLWRGGMLGKVWLLKLCRSDTRNVVLWIFMSYFALAYCSSVAGSNREVSQVQE
jgi:hypothetical protein